MRGRLLLGVALIGVGLGLGALLTSAEDKLEPVRAPAPAWSLPPPTEGQSYAKDLRKKNLQAVGLSGARLEEALDVAKEVDHRRKEVRAALLELDPRLVARTLCTDVEPALYRAAPLLLDGRDDQVRVRDVVVEGGRVDPSAGPTPEQIRGLYDTFERHHDGTTRPDSHALLALSALVVGHAAEATGGGRPDPWRAPTLGADPLKDVAARWPQGTAQLPRYVGTAEALAEIVNGDPGAYGCRGGGG